MKIISVTVASVITLEGMFRISQESWLCTPNAARTSMGLTPA